MLPAALGRDTAASAKRDPAAIDASPSHEIMFRVLGPVEVVAGGTVVDVPRRQERRLLAVLLVELNRVVSAPRLAELLWDGGPPDGARAMLRSHVSRLRTRLAAVGAGDNSPPELESTNGGYRLIAEPGKVDAHHFQSLVDHALAQTDPHDRITWLRAALDLWRGPAVDISDSDRLRERLCADLEERRLTAIEHYTSDSLILGNTDAVLAELAHATDLHPGRERLIELQMRALHQAGRKAEALAAYDRTRTYLADELGIDPYPALQDLHLAILRDQLAHPTVMRHTLPPRQLPTDTAGFCGRIDDLRHLDTMLTSQETGGPVVISTIAGMAGIGKTALAVHWARRVADKFPDGQLYADLRGFGASGTPVTPGEVVRGFLDALHVPPGRIPPSSDALIGLYRTILDRRRVLLLLDNARDSEQIRPLLPGTPGCFVIVTSRNELSGLTAAHGAHPLLLDPFAPSEARDLLERRLGHDRVAAEPDATNDIVHMCAGLPLALAVIAARATARPQLPLGALADELRDVDSGLDPWSDPGTATDLRTVFSWSYRTLTTEAAELFRLLGLHPEPDLSVSAAAGLADTTTPRARGSLTELARASLITEHMPGRYRPHRLIHMYATELAHTHGQPTRHPHRRPLPVRRR